MTPIGLPPELRYLFDKVGDDDTSALDRLFAGSALREGLDQYLTELAQVARAEEGFSWADVGKVLDITKQAAQQRFGKRDVLRVKADGTVTVSKNRADYQALLRQALDGLGDLELPKGAKPQVVEVEVEVEVPVKKSARKS